MGTLMNGLADVFRTITAGTAKRKGFQLVLSVGDQLDPEQIGPLPSNTILVKRAPQLELLKRASVCITHAGLNTALEALAQGVPQVAVPVSLDQPGVAARIAEKRTGLFVPLKELTASRLSLLLDQVLNDSTYRDSARYFQKVIAENQWTFQSSRSAGTSFRTCQRRPAALGVRTRNGNLSTVRSSLLVDWSANALSRNAQPPSQSSWSFQYPFCRKTSCNRVLKSHNATEDQDSSQNRRKIPRR